MKKFSEQKYNWLLIILMTALAVVMVWRAYWIPFTHDEGTTWFDYRHKNLWPCFFDSSCWASANNHWLNSLLMQFCGSIFGDEPWALRLPNELAGIGYLVAAYLLVTRYVKTYSWQIFGFLSLCAHVYLLDFFSLARGYGMMTTGTLWGIYALFRYSEQFELRWFWVLLISQALSILSNFTALIPFVAIFLVWGILLLMHKRYDLLWKQGRIVGEACLILIILLRYPLQILSRGGEFEWGADNVVVMSRNLFTNLFGSAQYFGWHNPERVMIYFFLLVLISFFVFVFNPALRKNEKLRIAFLLFGSVLVTMLLIQYATHAKTPIGRKAIFLIPMIFLVPALSESFFRKKWALLSVSMLGSTLLVLHFFVVGKDSIKSCREWYYDAYYPELLSVLVPQQSESDSVKVGASWIFTLSLSFYTVTDSLPISGLVYQKDLVVDPTMDYYYVQEEERVKFDSTAFKIDRKIGPFYLFRKDPTLVH